MSAELDTVSAENDPTQPWWSIWAGMHWGFRKHACVLWAAYGRLPVQRARQLLEIDSLYPVDVMVFYRELVCELTPEYDLAQMIVDAMPLAERKHMKQYGRGIFAGHKAFQSSRHSQSIAHLMNRPLVLGGLQQLRETDDSDDDTRIADARHFAEGLRLSVSMRSGDVPLRAPQRPLILIHEDCPQLSEAIPSIQSDEKNPEDIKIVGNEQDSIWEAAKTCYRECPSVAGGLPRHIKRQQFIDKGITMQQRYLNAIEFDRKNSRPQRIVKRR